MGDRAVFIAYAESDSSVAVGLASELRILGHSTWTYEENGAAGFSYLEQGLDAIQDCEAFVLLASKTSIQSHQVSREAETAYEHKKLIIPVRVHISQEEMHRSRIFRMATGTAVSIATDGTNLQAIASRITTS